MDINFIILSLKRLMVSEKVKRNTKPVEQFSIIDYLPPHLLNCLFTYRDELFVVLSEISNNNQKYGQFSSVSKYIQEFLENRSIGNGVDYMISNLITESLYSVYVMMVLRSALILAFMKQFMDDLSTVQSGNSSRMIGDAFMEFVAIQGVACEDVQQDHIDDFTRCYGLHLLNPDLKAALSQDLPTVKNV